MSWLAFLLEVGEPYQRYLSDCYAIKHHHALKYISVNPILHHNYSVKLVELKHNLSDILIWHTFSTQYSYEKYIEWKYLIKGVKTVSYVGADAQWAK